MQNRLTLPNFPESEAFRLRPITQGYPIPPAQNVLRPARSNYPNRQLAGKPYDEAEENMKVEAQDEFAAEQLAQDPLIRKVQDVAQRLGLGSTPFHLP